MIFFILFVTFQRIGGGSFDWFFFIAKTWAKCKSLKISAFLDIKKLFSFYMKIPFQLFSIHLKKVITSTSKWQMKLTQGFTSINMHSSSPHWISETGKKGLERPKEVLIIHLRQWSMNKKDLHCLTLRFFRHDFHSLRYFMEGLKAEAARWMVLWCTSRLHREAFQYVKPTLYSDHKIGQSQ